MVRFDILRTMVWGLMRGLNANQSRSCSARSLALVCCDTPSSEPISSSPVATTERVVCAHDHGGTLPDIKGLGPRGFWALKPPVQGSGTSRIRPYLRVILRPIFIAGIVAYQSILRPSMAGSCRFYPTCSVYAIDAFYQHGLVTALMLIVWRIIRCNPWGQCGYDPVPSSLFSSS
jgi:putative membrane protein insertion efficiency factor